MPSQESQEEIKRDIEQWRWSEMQGLELVSENPPIPNPNPNLDPLSEEDKEAQNSLQRRRLEMETEGQNSKNDGDKEKKKEKSVSDPTVGFGELFRFADGLDYVLMGIGTVGAFVHGCSLPIFLRFFADLVNSFGSNANNIDKMSQEVLKVTPFFFSRIVFFTKISFFYSTSSLFLMGFVIQYAFYFLVVGAAIWASSWAGL